MVQSTAIFFLVFAFTVPVVDFNATALPIPHGVLLNGFVRAQDLTGAKTGIPPEFGNLVETPENSCANAISLQITRSEQQEAPGRLQILYHTFTRSKP